LKQKKTFQDEKHNFWKM